MHLSVSENACSKRPPQLLDARQLQTLSQRQDVAGLLRLFSHLTLLVALCLLVQLSHSHGIRLLAMTAEGIILVALFAPLHESIHRTAFRTPAINAVVAWLCGSVLLLLPAYFRQFHLAHHRHAQNPELDPELSAPKPQSWGAYLFALSGLPYWWERITTTLLLAAGGGDLNNWHWLQTPQAIRKEARLFVGIYATIFLLSWLLGSTAVWEFWIVPALLGMPALRGYLMAEHTGCAQVPNSLLNTRTTPSMAMVRWLMWNMPYHAEHHLYPSVPFHALPQLHDEVHPHLHYLAPGYSAVHRAIQEKL
ncbi:MAG: fatty acid desaturase [Cyanobacteria bacterium QH_1_48_107]|nr:MAG: fatty acid desaturase [Cyanobacteria bacterium QH_1_48_107]